jgi:mono/diheme cytochrome c family protein
MADRAKNIQLALNDRQAVFKGDCRSCHVDKGVGKLGKELYDADCGICHDDAHRAAMVPDLKVPRSHRDLAFWQKWIAEGKPGTMMPGFSQEHGGPLTKEQVTSLVNYLYQNYPKDPPASTSQQQAHLPAPLPPGLPQKN